MVVGSQNKAADSFLATHYPLSTTHYPLNYVLVEQPGVLAALSRRRSRVQISSGTLEAKCEKVRRGAKRCEEADRKSRAQRIRFAVFLPFRTSSHPFAPLRTPLPPRVGWALASLSGCNPPVFGLWRFNSVPTHSRPVLLTVQDASPSSSQCGFDSRTGRSLRRNTHDQVVERQTHSAQNAAPRKGHGSSSLPLVTW